jgi:integrase
MHGVARQAAAEVATTLQHDATFVRGSVNVQEMLSDIFLSIVDAVPASTADKDGKDWESWCATMQRLGASPLRMNVTAHQGHDSAGYWAEVIYQAIAYFDVMKSIQPRSSKSPAAKPTSVTVVKSIRRVHSYFGVQMASSKLYHRVLKAACDRFIDEHGLSALLPKQKEAFTNAEVALLLSIAQHNTVYGVVVNHRSRLWRSILMLVHVMAQTGLRLGDALRLNRDAIFFDLLDCIVPRADKQMVEALTSSACALLRVGRTKSDPLGTYWSPFPVYLPVDKTGALNAGRLLYEYDSDFPVDQKDKSRTPLFSDAQGVRLKRPFLERVLKDWMATVGILSDKHSWHSWRSYLACALKATNADDSVIKAMVRWVSDKSLRLYARSSKQDYAGWLAKAASADVSTVCASSLPEMDDDRAMATLHSMLSSSGLVE